LLGQYNQLIASQLFPGLKCLDGAEGPAAAALPLVLDWGQRASVSPVFGGRDLGFVFPGSPLREFLGNESTKLDRLELVSGKIRQARNPHGVRCS